jgi:hypothetical protein
MKSLTGPTSILPVLRVTFAIVVIYASGVVVIAVRGPRLGVLGAIFLVLISLEGLVQLCLDFIVITKLTLHTHSVIGAKIHSMNTLVREAASLLMSG